MPANYKYYDVGGLLIRSSGGEFPEVTLQAYREGKWEAFFETHRVAQDGYEIDAATAEQMMAQLRERSPPST